MKTETKHTPGPWIAFYGNRDDKEMILDSNQNGCDGYFATLHGTKETQRANAAFILAAVNSHAALTAALDATVEALEAQAMIKCDNGRRCFCDRLPANADWHTGHCNIANAALEQAKKARG